MRRAASVILGLWLLNILLMTACGQSQLDLDATAVKAVRDARTAHAPTKTPTAAPSAQPVVSPTMPPVATPTVMLVCTPPFCSSPNYRACGNPNGCPGGCGTVCIAPNLPPVVTPTAIPTLTPTKTATAAPAPVLLASGQAHPNSLVVDSEALYWANCGTDPGASTDGAIMVYSKRQGISQTLVSGLSCPSVLQADTDSLFWRNHRWTPPESSIFRVSKSGGQPVELASFPAVIGNLAVDDTYVYWRGANGVVMRLPKTGVGTPQPAPVPALVFDGPDAYWLNSDGDLIRSGKNGSSAITLVRGSDLKKLAGRQYSTVDITQVCPKLSEIYFAVSVNDNPGMGSCSDNSLRLMRIPKSGGDYKEVVWVNGGALVLVTEPFVYFSGDCTGGIRKATLGTAKLPNWMVQIGETVVESPEEAWEMAEDAGYVYWTDFMNGLIKKVAK